MTELHNSFLSMDTADKPVKLAFAESSGIVYVISTDYDARWPSHILRIRTASISINGNRSVGVPYLISSSEEKKTVIDLFKGKYGQEYVSRYFSHPARFVGIDTKAEINSKTDSYYTWLEEEFDSVADDYDNHIFGNPVNMLLRKRSLELLRKYSPRSGHIIEIGCGTGAETLELLKDGHDVLAIDISGKMLSNVMEKARQEGVSSQLSTVKMKASSMSDLISVIGESAFDLGYSTYGALNCEPDIEKIPKVLGQLIKPKGYFLAGVYNKFCFSETVANMLSLRPFRLFWRFQNPIKEGRSRFCIDVYSFSSTEFTKIFKESFRQVEIVGVPVILPPSNYTNFIALMSRRLDRLIKFDDRIGKMWPWKYLGDHFLAILENAKVS